MQIGDLVIIIADNREGLNLLDIGDVGIITERDDDYEAKGITGSIVNLIKVNFGATAYWFDSDQIQLLPKTDKNCPGQNA